MSLLLLAFGAMLAVAGIILAAFGVSIHDHTFDTSVITPGVVAAVGGLLLIGLGLALRVLQRIERALAVRPRAEPDLALGAELPDLAHPQHRSAAAAPSTSTGNPAEQAPEKSPRIARLEATRAVAATDASRSPNPIMPFPTGADAASAQIDKAQSAKRTNGVTAPRLDPRPSIAAERPSGPSFDALWPKGPRAAQAGQPATTPPASSAPAPATEPKESPEPAVEPPETTAVAAEFEPVSVLKSGVVDGMAYTLFSDGSIEAQLPQGTLRFGSIAELRNHIEQSA